MSVTLLLCALGNAITGWCVGWLMRGDYDRRSNTIPTSENVPYEQVYDMGTGAFTGSPTPDNAQEG